MVVDARGTFRLRLEDARMTTPAAGVVGVVVHDELQKC